MTDLTTAANANDDIIDLTRVAASVAGGSKPRERFKAAVRAATGAMAERLDLSSARQCLETIAAIDEVTTAQATAETFIQDAGAGLVARALYLTAVIHYVRATESRSRHKPKPDYEGAYTRELRGQHRAIMTLRDDALAHWGPGRDMEGQMHHNITVIGQSDGARCYHEQVNYRAHIINDLAALLDVAIPVAVEKSRTALVNAHDSFQALIAAEPKTEIQWFDRPADWIETPYAVDLGSLRTPSDKS